MREFIAELLKEAGSVAMGFFHGETRIESKRHAADLVTCGDFAVSDLIVSRLDAAFPEHAIECEEKPEVIRPEAKQRWILDPIDGTRNFAQGLPYWCTMLALYEGNEGLAAGIYNPVVDMMYIAERGEGVTLNGRKVSLEDTAEIKFAQGAVIADPLCEHYDHLKGVMTHLMDEGCWLMNYGTMFGAVAMATGGLNFFMNNCGFDHDYAAPACILKEAGADIFSLNGEPWRRGDRVFGASVPGLTSYMKPLLYL